MEDIDRRYVDDSILKYFSNENISNYTTRFLAEQVYLEFRGRLNGGRRKSGKSELSDCDIVNFLQTFEKCSLINLLNPRSI